MGWKWDFVPDTVWGLSVRPACDIHDWMWAHATDIAGMDAGNRVFLNNMLRIVEARGGWLRRFRRRRCYAYYLAVAKFGSHHFWRGKNPTNTEQEVPDGNPVRATPRSR